MTFIGAADVNQGQTKNIDVHRAGRKTLFSLGIMKTVDPHLV